MLAAALLIWNRRLARQAEQCRDAIVALNRSDDLFRALFEQSAACCMILEPTSSGIPNIIDVNEAACRTHGYTREELLGRPVTDIDDDDGKEQCRERTRHLLAGEPLRVRNTHVRKDGRHVPMAIYADVIQFEPGRPLILSTEYDISELTEAEERAGVLERKLLQSQKIEALGTLAGGIAHDFNNILSVIVAYAGFVQSAVPPGSQEHEDIGQVLSSSQRATELIKQILAFGRHGATTQAVVDVRAIVEEALAMLRASTPATVAIECTTTSEATGVLGDGTQIQQAFINLFTNATHALGASGGAISVALRRIEVVQDDPLSPAHVPPGVYARLRVADTGPGIEPEHLDRVFEPYFTTKAGGDGSGLGLAMVNGIVKAHRGFIEVENSPGEGVAFQLFFPIIDEELEVKPAMLEAPPVGTEHLLIVDDEEQLRLTTQRRLSGLGYRTTCCSDGREALELVRQDPQRFDMVITDQAMPELTGAKLAQALHTIRPGLPVILCSGNLDQRTVRELGALGLSALLWKPTDIHDLATAIRRGLDGSPG